MGRVHPGVEHRDRLASPRRAEAPDHRGARRRNALGEVRPKRLVAPDPAHAIVLGQREQPLLVDRRRGERQNAVVAGLADRVTREVEAGRAVEGDDHPQDPLVAQRGQQPFRVAPAWRVLGPCVSWQVERRRGSDPSEEGDGRSGREARDPLGQLPVAQIELVLDARVGVAGSAAYNERRALPGGHAVRRNRRRGGDDQRVRLDGQRSTSRCRCAAGQWAGGHGTH